MQRSVFFVSDRTGLTAEALGRSLLTQFDNIRFDTVTLPFIDTVAKAHAARERIDAVVAEGGERPLVFCTFVDAGLRRELGGCTGICIDFFDAFIEPLEQELGMRSSHAMGRSHGVDDGDRYHTRMAAVNYALAHDDGVKTEDYPAADIILLGVSRTGKTPTALYLSMQYALRVANYPLTDHEIDSARLPAVLQPLRARLFGLTIQPERLQQLRQERLPGSRYARLSQCQYEVAQIEALYRNENITMLDTTSRSIEEIAAMIVHGSGALKTS